MPKQPDMPCAACGKLMWRGQTSLPEGQATCRECRRHVAAGTRKKPNACARCGEPCIRIYCSNLCANTVNNAKRGRYGQSMTGKRKLRAVRAASAPGLSDTARRRLLKSWKRQGRRCAYCPTTADTIDHVVPLLRGGDNREGNLAPCCRRCNAAKGYRLLIEWRTGRRAPLTIAPVPTLTGLASRPASRPTRKPARPLIAVQQELRICPVCSTLHSRPVYCSLRCCQVANERRKTERSRKPTRTACPQGHPYTPENRRIRTRIRNGVPKTETECLVCWNGKRRAA